MRTYFRFNVRRFAELTRLDLNSLLKDLREITGRSEILAYGIPLEENAHTKDGGSMMRLSQCVLLAYEDKIFQGAFVASLSIPWGDTKDDNDRGGYHLVWTRDMVQTATALLACGQTESPLRALIWLACVQAADGSLPQNSSITGEAFWKGMQLDEVAMPILLAWRLKHADALRQFNPWTLVSRAARYLILHGPVTGQEPWEENSGYSPSTLATIIASLVCAAEFARGRKDKLEADFLLDYTDWLSAHLEEWIVTNRGELVKGKPRQYVRITPADPKQAVASPDPDKAEFLVANGGDKHPARNIVGGDFLQLVRLGVRAADDPLMVDSLAVIDQVLKRDLPQGPCWRRYNHDGYGQEPDGNAYDGTGEGRCWPIVTGERAHYELAAGRDPLPFIEAMEKFANEGGMLPEQLWDADDLPEGKMKRGGPTGSAMPLCWSHAEYAILVRSHKDGVCFDRIEPVYQRYARAGTGSQIEIWTLAHQTQRIAQGKTLGIVIEKAATIHGALMNGRRRMTWKRVMQDSVVGSEICPRTGSAPASSSHFWGKRDGREKIPGGDCWRKSNPKSGMNKSNWPQVATMAEALRRHRCVGNELLDLKAWCAPPWIRRRDSRAGCRTPAKAGDDQGRHR